MKKTKIVVPALAVLLLSTAASVSGTVAWFSMNTSINVTGMTVTTKVSSSLQISATNADNLFSNTDLQQTRGGRLQPASTVNGHNFFYTTNAKSNGDANAEQYPAYAESTALNAAQLNTSGKTHYDTDFNSAYGCTDYNPEDNTGSVAFAYIDYSFYLRANIVGTAQKISMDRCNLLYGDSTPGELNTEWAWRVALFSSLVDLNAAEEDSVTTNPTNNHLVSILDLANSKNQNEITPSIPTSGTDVSAYYIDPQLKTHPTGAAATADGKTMYYQPSAEDGSPKAVSVNNAAPTAVTYNTAATVASGVTGDKVYKVVVRLWLEGEDVSCTSSTFADLDEHWSLNISFALGADDGVTVIGSDPSEDFSQH